MGLFGRVVTSDEDEASSQNTGRDTKAGHNRSAEREHGNLGKKLTRRAVGM